MQARGLEAALELETAAIEVAGIVASGQWPVARGSEAAPELETAAIELECAAIELE